ncbi:TPA: fimbrial protein [Serratia marcescens]
MKRKFQGIIFCGILITTATKTAWAYSCNTTTSVTVLSPPSVVVQRDLPVGSPIGSEVISATVRTFSCTNTPSPSLQSQYFGVKAYGSYVTTINGRRVYSTNISGVGYAIGMTPISACAGVTAYVDGTNTGDGNVNNKLACLSNGLMVNQPMTAQARIQYYKTAQTIGTGTVNAKQIGSFILLNNQQSWHLPESAISTTAFNVTTVACSVSTPNVNVTLPTVNAGSFTGIGNTLGDTPFTIGLQCDANARINATLNFTQDGDTTNQSVAAVTGKGSAGIASGVGIQLLYGSTPLNNNVLTFLKTSSGGQELPAGAFTARYFQTKSTVQAGTANTTATMTLSYQ